MATTQLVRTDNVLETGSSLKISTQQESLVYVKKLVAVGLSTIAYLRIKKIPEDAFADTSENGLQLKILRDDSLCVKAKSLVEWLKGCFDAIEKKYLRQMTLVIENAKNSTVVEIYSFRFKYPENGGASITQLESFSNESEYNEMVITESAIGMMRTILILGQTLEPLPPELDLSMQLKYFDEITPEDYEPPGFHGFDDEAKDFTEEPLTIKVGDVETRFHCVKMRVRCLHSMYGMRDSKKLTNGGSTLLDSDGMLTRRMPGKIRPPVQSSKLSSKGTPGHYLGTSGSTNSPARSMSVIDNYLTPKASPSLLPSYLPGSVCSIRSGRLSNDEETTSFAVKCPCNITKEHGLMIICDVCGYWQHSACFTIIEPSQAPDRHVCHECADPPSLCTDPRLVFADPDLVEVTCLFRRALVLIYQSEETAVSVSGLAHSLGIEAHVSAKIIKKLSTENVLIDGESELFKNINRDVLMYDLLPKYVRAVEEKKGTQASVPSSQTSDVTFVPSIEEKENEEPIPSSHRLKTKKRKWNISPKQGLDYEISDSQNSSMKGNATKGKRSAQIK